ncbi:MAG TPA: hypothetical protein VKA63_04455 [Candidatus Krumholzibacteria bacterium]|nr:hypothetical protein [Candidatus Krumholzibacteria bacterium]
MKKFMIGCGIVVGVILLISIVSSWIFVRSLKNQLPEIKPLKEREEQLVKLYGRLDDYTPPLNGRISPERMELYLQIRENQPHDTQLFVDALDEVSEQEKEMHEATGLEKLKRGLKMAKSGMAVARVTMVYLSARDSLLLADEMSPGEYLYLTVIGAVCDLQWSPPRCRNQDAVADSTSDHYKFSGDYGSFGDVYRRQLENALRDLRGRENLDEDEQNFMAQLEGALEHGRIGDARVPFEGELPASLKESVEPYRDRLQATLPTCLSAWSLELATIAGQHNEGVNIKIGEDDDH